MQTKLAAWKFQKDDNFFSYLRKAGFDLDNIIRAIFSEWVRF